MLVLTEHIDSTLEGRNYGEKDVEGKNELFLKLDTGVGHSEESATVTGNGDASLPTYATAGAKEEQIR